MNLWWAVLFGPVVVFLAFVYLVVLWAAAAPIQAQINIDNRKS